MWYNTNGDTMSELLAPAGSFEALVAAISNGADAVYLGMNQFGARAYAANFDVETLKQAIRYAHLRNVKIYVTMNTIVFEEELSSMRQMVQTLYEVGVDSLIVQDLAVLNEVVTHYPQMEVHCSTQMGIDDTEGTLFCKNLGASRVVLAREVPIEQIRKIKEETKIDLEVFVHGALCVSYSGNCLMSGLIGYRSGNRGRCVGSCRKPYELVDLTQNITYPKTYLLSMKDLNTFDQLDQLAVVDSLKIEGRMKEPAYVANVVSAYRNQLDGKTTIREDGQRKLKKTFQRTFTKGYLFHENPKDITNIERPNNYGFLIGKITGKNKNGYQLSLTEPLYQGDILRIDHQKRDINLTAQRIYDEKGDLIRFATKRCYLKLKEDLSVNDAVYKTKEVLFYQELEKSYPKEFRRFPIRLNVEAYPYQPLKITASCDGKNVFYQSEDILYPAENKPLLKEDFEKQFSRLNDTVYRLDSVTFLSDHVFVPVTKINEARRQITERLDQARLPIRKKIKRTEAKKEKIAFDLSPVQLTVFATTEEQKQAAEECGISIIYTKENTIRRNQTTYPSAAKPLLIGGYGGIYAYRQNRHLVSDFSLNVVNSESVYLLHALGVERVTLSHEMNKKQIKQLIQSYYEQNDGYPNLEMIVYGRADLLFTKYCPLKKFNLCGSCKTNRYALKDEYGSFPILSHDDCTTTILNGKILNLIDHLEELDEIRFFRIQLTTETKEESKTILKQFLHKLKTNDKTKLFNPLTDTRGHFNKEIL